MPDFRVARRLPLRSAWKRPARAWWCWWPKTIRTRLSGYLEFLGRSGYVATGSADGKEALGLAVETVPDIVVTDINMPGLDGFGWRRRSAPIAAPATCRSSA